MPIQVEDDVQFCSLELNGNFVKNWTLVYEHQDSCAILLDSIIQRDGCQK
ncbi:hypothetical protein M3899_003253 [Vibrio parahaemolyticus]|nr:hypothetical protein [Vibrio parahaemolyticus]